MPFSQMKNLRCKEHSEQGTEASETRNFREYNDRLSPACFVKRDDIDEIGREVSSLVYK